MSIPNKFLRKVIYFITIIILIPLLILAILTLREFKPEPESLLYSTFAPDTLKLNDTLQVLSWNIGYAGLGSNMDFFYEGGKQVFDTYENTRSNLFAINKYLDGQQSADFIFLQEVDRLAKRTYKIDEFANFDSLFTGRNSHYATNYRCDFVPVPLPSPMGKVESGIVSSFSKKPLEVKRISLPGKISWPVSLFELKRCSQVSRFVLSNCKELIIINTHISAYDDGDLKSQQINALGNFMLDEYQKGNYVVAGGDWNQCPANFSAKYSAPFDTLFEFYLPESYLPGWPKIYSDSIPTNRNVSKVFNTETSLQTVIDYFILSPNILKVNYRVENLGFINSDHQPVLLSFTFK